MNGTPDDAARLESLVAIPGDEPGGALALVLRGAPQARLLSALRHGFETVAVVPPDGSARGILEAGPDGLREAGPDALVAAAAALRARTLSAFGAAEPLPGGGYAIETRPTVTANALSAGAVGGALGLDPEFVADTGRTPFVVEGIGPAVLVVPVEDRECVEEARPDPAALRRAAEGRDPSRVVLVVTGPRGTALPEPLPLTVFRAGDWPRPLASSVAAALAAALVDGAPGPGGPARLVIFTPARDAAGGGAASLPTMGVEKTAPGNLRVTTTARRLL